MVRQKPAKLLSPVQIRVSPFLLGDRLSILFPSPAVFVSGRGQNFLISVSEFRNSGEGTRGVAQSRKSEAFR